MIREHEARPRGVRPAHAQRRWHQGRPATCGEQTRIVMLTVSEQERDLLDAVAAGAVGYLVKSHPARRAARRALAGRAGRAGVLARRSPRWCSASSGACRRTRPVPSRCPSASARCCRRRPRPHLQGDRRAAVHRREDGREPRAQHPRQAPPQPEAGAHPLRRGARHRHKSMPGGTASNKSPGGSPSHG